eukprot:sb/3477821/
MRDSFMGVQTGSKSTSGGTPGTLGKSTTRSVYSWFSASDHEDDSEGGWEVDSYVCEAPDELVDNLDWWSKYYASIGDENLGKYYASIGDENLGTARIRKYCSLIG